MRPGEFIQFLWQPALTGKVSAEVAEGCVTLWELRGKKSHHVDLATLPDWDAEDDELKGWALDRDVYTSPGLRRPGLDADQRGRKKDVIALCGAVLDVDMAHGVHKAGGTLPATDEDIDRILEGFLEPTIAVSTGGGLHFWWLFNETLETLTPSARTYAHRALLEFQKPFITRANLLGFHLDKTHSIDRVFRLPGTKNWKRPNQPADVEVLFCGNRYDIQQVLTLPESRASSSSSASSSSTVSASGEKGIAAVRTRLKKLKPDHENKFLVEQLLAGESLAEKGERDFALQKAVSMVVFYAGKLTEDDIPDLAEIFRPSLEVWTAEPDAEKDIDEELAKVAEKMERAFAERDEKRAHESRAERAITRMFQKRTRIEATPVPTPPTPPAPTPSAAPTESISAGNPAAPSETKAEIKAPWLEAPLLLQYGNVTWAWSFGLQDEEVGFLKKGFYGPFNERELLVQLKRCWDGVWDDIKVKEIDLYIDGKAKSSLMLSNEYAVGVHEVAGHLDLDHSYFDRETVTFHRAMCPPRVTEAVFDEGVDDWLRILGGADADKLLDWIAAVPQLSRQSAALYLEGDSSVGKSMLARALSRIWKTGGATGLTRIMMTPFNAPMFSCPFILLDEGLPTNAKQSSAFIRSLIGSNDHEWSQKGKPTHRVEGCVRLMIAANNDRVLEQLANEELGEADVEALSERFLHIKAQREAADWIKTVNDVDRSIIDAWTYKDVIAKHCLWLAKNREIVPGNRFLVEGNPTDMHRALLTRGRDQMYVLEWLTKYVENPDWIERAYAQQPNKKPLIYLGGGQLLVNTQAIVTKPIEDDEAKRRTPSPVRIGRILTALSKGKRHLGSREDRVKFHLINYEHVRRAAEDLQLDLEKMETNFNRPADFIVEDPEPESKLKLVP